MNPSVRQPTKSNPRPYMHPGILLLVVTASIFVVEGIIMTGLHFVSSFSPVTESILDAGILTLVIFPVIYFSFFRPLISHFREREKAEAELQSMHDELEERVKLRTQELKSVNDSLRQEIDIRVQIENELRKLNQAVEQSPASVVITNTSGIIEYVNPKFTELTGYTHQEAVGQNPRILKSGIQPKSFYEKLWATITAGHEWRGEFGNRKKNGEIYWESATIAPVKSPDGKITHYVAVKDDITQQKKDRDRLQKSEQEQRELSRKYSDANNLKALLLDIITHDLKNPAGVICAMIEILKQNDPDDEMIDAIFNSSTSLLRVIENASALAGISMEEKILLKPLDLVPIIQDSIKEFQSILKARGMELTIHLPLKLMVDGNPIIAEVFKNYLSNAVKYATEGKRLIITGKVQDYLVEVALYDFGSTIPEEDREKIFTRRIQLENGRRRGHGLGLAIVRKIADAHGAMVGVRPNQPTGNVFFLQIPLSGKEDT
ncbi:MAG: PAS domain S-box protein [FCB group bacterium]|nr:PAS domain S-box protein [FCB group bacterium]